MVQPIQYQIPGALNPFENLVSGLKLGATMADMDAARAQQQAASQLAQQKAEQQRIAQEALAKFQQKPFSQVTPGDISPLIGMVPPESLKVLSDLVGSQSAIKNNNMARNYGQMLSAVKSGNVAAAKDIAEKLAEGETDESIKRGYTLLSQGFDKSPDAAAKQIALMMQELGGDYTKMATKVLEIESTPAAETGQTISTPAAKQAAGLVDENGKPLPGTYFLKPGQAPTLVKGEVAPEVKKGYTVLTPAEAKAKGLPTAGYTWQFNQDTNDISALVKPQQAAVQVNIPGQARPPTKLEEAIDTKFAPIAVDWMGGEKTKAASRINQLNAVTKILETKKRITGPVLGLTPDVVQSFVSPASREARANAERVIQEGLRATIGAQFTRAEGEAFLARSYDPKAPQEDNARRLRSIVTQMQESAKDREAMVKYMQGLGEGSLKGYTGRIPSIDDFYAAIEEKAPVAAAPQPSAPAVTSPAKAAAVNAAVEKYRSK